MSETAQPDGQEPEVSLAGSSVEPTQEATGAVQPPLTEEQIQKMNEARYPKRLSADEIHYINQARARGIHHDIV